MTDAIVIGGGHNGLVAAAYLARAGLKTLVLERRDEPGGAALTGPLAPGFRCPTLAHEAAAFDPGILADLQLRRHGLALSEPDVALVVPALEGPPLVLSRERGRDARHAGLSPSDAEGLQRFEAALAAAAALLRPVLAAPPPAVDRLAFGDLWRLFGAARRFRGLNGPEAYRLLRWLPMPAADLVDEWFASPLLRAAVASRGVHGIGLGPRAMGTGANLLLRAALDGAVAGGRTVFPIGGMGALTAALAEAARTAGAEIRTGADVAGIRVEKGKAAGVVLRDGRELTARLVVSGLDPRRTLLGLVDPAWIDPDLRQRLAHYRCRGSVAKINLALDALPRFTAAGGRDEAGMRALLAGRVLIAPSIDYLERASDAAKYGAWSPEPYLELAIPSLTDPSLAPEGRHVLSVHVQYAPYELREGNWREARDALADAALATLERWAPGFAALVLHRQVITPLDLEEQYGLTGGHPFHGEHALDQLFLMRPVPGLGRYVTPVRGLYLCGAGTHPGGGVTGLPGALAARIVLADARGGAGRA